MDINENTQVLREAITEDDDDTLPGPTPPSSSISEAWNICIYYIAINNNCMIKPEWGIRVE